MTATLKLWFEHPLDSFRYVIERYVIVPVGSLPPALRCNVRGDFGRPRRLPDPLRHVADGESRSVGRAPHGNAVAIRKDAFRTARSAPPRTRLADKDAGRP